MLEPQWRKALWTTLLVWLLLSLGRRHLADLPPQSYPLKPQAWSQPKQLPGLAAPPGTSSRMARRVLTIFSRNGI